MRKAHGGRTGILFVNGPTQPPLGADTWIHTQIIRHVDRTKFDPVAACVTGTADQPTPCYEALRAVTDVEVVPIDVGPELSTTSSRSRLRTLVDTLPAITSFVRLARLIRRRRIALIHTSDRPRDAALCVLLARLTRARCIVHVHVGYGDWMSPLLKWAMRRADALIAVSAFVADTLVDSGHRRERIHVVLNAIDTDKWTPGVGRDEIRCELGVAPDAPLVLTVCRLFEAKGPRQLIEALPAVRAKAPNVQLVIVGREMQLGFRAELEDLARNLRVDEHVVFTGQRSDVPQLMAAADVYAMPSHCEPFGLVFAEAMAMRLPVVALDNGGTPEVVADGLTGLLSSPGDQRALADNLSALLTDPVRRACMGAQGRARVLDHFTLPRMSRDVERVYAELAETSSGTTARGEDPINLLPTSRHDPCLLRRELDTKGFAVLRGVVSRERLAEFARVVTTAFDKAPRFKGGGMVTGHLNCFPGRNARFAWDELIEAGVVDSVYAIRGGRPNQLRVTMNFNMPGSVAQHYHMDGAYLDDFLICNVAVVDTTVENGAIDLLPETNQHFMPFWKYALSRQYKKSTRIEMQAGDVLLRKSNLWHRGMPNHATVARPLLSFTFGEQSAPDDDPFEVNGGEFEFYANWYSTSRAGRARERTFKSFPLSYATYRFVDSLRDSKRGYESWD